MEKHWCVYLLRCADGSQYCGMTNNLHRRFQMHCAGKGAKYTRGRGPLQIVYVQSCADKSAALRQELTIKAMTKSEKEAMAEQFLKNTKSSMNLDYLQKPNKKKEKTQKSS